MQHAHDPDGTAWRRAVRAAVVVPGVFAVGIALGSDVVALYALFGAMAHLVFGDYGGPPGHRAAAYLTTTLGGLVLICAGTAVSGNYVGAAIATVVVGLRSHARGRRRARGRAAPHTPSPRVRAPGLDLGPFR